MRGTNKDVLRSFFLEATGSTKEVFVVFIFPVEKAEIK